MTPAAGRTEVLAHVADSLVARRQTHPLRVAVDGITASGKSTFAAQLTVAVAARGRPALHLSTDDYHHQRAHRYRQGRDSAAGYYEDAYDLAAFHRLVLQPLGPGGDLRYRARYHDLTTDEFVDEEPASAPPDAVVIVDGSFLQRPELAGGWDEVIFLDTSPAVARVRGIERDALAFGGPDEAGRAYDLRYHAAAALYLADVDPVAAASIVIDHDDLAEPRLRRIDGTSRN